MFHDDSDEEYSVNSENESSDSDEQDLASAHRNSDAQLHKLIKQLQQIPAIDTSSSPRNSSNNQLDPSSLDEMLIASGRFTSKQIQNYKKAEELITLQADIMQNASKPSFNQAKAVDHINTILGAKFIKNYIITGRGNWQIDKTIAGDVTLTLQGLQVPTKSDCEWYKAKLIKNGIEESNIHFDAYKLTDGKTIKYKIRLTCVQDIELKQEPETNRNLSGYELFLEEMNDQIENIKTAQSLLQLEQQMIKISPSKGCLRDFQNDRKLAIQVKLIELFERAKSQSNEKNYETTRNEVYQKAKQMGYQKTHAKQEAVDAYQRRLDWT